MTYPEFDGNPVPLSTTPQIPVLEDMDDGQHNQPIAPAWNDHGRIYQIFQDRKGIYENYHYSGGKNLEDGSPDETRYFLQNVDFQFSTWGDWDLYSSNIHTPPSPSLWEETPYYGETLAVHSIVESLSQCLIDGLHYHTHNMPFPGPNDGTKWFTTHWRFLPWGYDFYRYGHIIDYVWSASLYKYNTYYPQYAASPGISPLIGAVGLLFLLLCLGSPTPATAPGRRT